MLDEEWPDHGFELDYFTRCMVDFRASTRQTLEFDLLDHGVRAQAVIAQVGFSLGAGLLDKLPGLKGIVVPGVGYDHVDLSWAASRGISVSHIPDYCTEEVAEHTLAFILYFLRDLGAMDRDVREGIWQPLRYLRNRPAKEAMIGLVGVGRIGQRVARKAGALGFRILAYDPYRIPEDMEGLGVEWVSLEELMSRSDYVSIHVPLGEETRGLITAKKLALMQSSAVLINTARSAVVDQQALLDLLESRRIRGAGLDVFDEEPLSDSSRWLELPNVLLTPHSAYVTGRAVNELRRQTCEEALRILNGELVRHPVS